MSQAADLRKYPGGKPPRLTWTAAQGTFTPPRTLPQRITDALAALRTLREQGTPSDVKKAANVLDSLLDRYPRRSTAQE